MFVVVKKTIIDELLAASKNTHPNEFFALLEGKKEKHYYYVEGFVFIPGTFGKGFSSINLHLKPLTDNYIGSFHSHPSFSNKPSRKDLETFPVLGEVHAISAYPYEIGTTRFYDKKGNILTFYLVE